MLEMQQQNMLKYPDRKLLMLNIDAGGVQSRRVLDRIIAQERNSAQQGAAVAG
jgi:vanillate O-demethylase monooxygenase subunit